MDDPNKSDKLKLQDEEDKDFDLDENGYCIAVLLFFLIDNYRIPIFYRYNLPSGNTFIVTQRFTDLAVIGHGSYGIVCSAYDEKLKKRVAIKRNNVIDNFLYCKRLLRELVILRVLDHPNIIKLHHIQRIVDSKNFNAIYLVTDLMETDLDQVIKSNQPLTNEHIQYFMYQVLLGIKYIHSAGLIHRDLKPSNILINSNCDIKICDFGLSVSEKSQMTHYVVSRWYRAPELVIGERKYTKSIDMWSIGCIFAELLLRRTLFPGKSPFDQFMCFIRILGSPSSSSFRTGIPQFLNEQIRRKEKEYNRGFPFPARPFDVIFGKNATKEAIDLLKNLIVYDSRKRFSVEQALAHPYFADLHDPTDEPVAGFRLQFEDYESKLSNFREVKLLIYKQSLIYNRKELRERFLRHRNNNNREEEEEEEDDEEEEIKKDEMTDPEVEEELSKYQDDGMDELENEILGFGSNNNNNNNNIPNIPNPPTTTINDNINNNWNMNQNSSNMNTVYSGFTQNNNNNNNNNTNIGGFVVFTSAGNNNNNNTRIIVEEVDEDEDDDEVEEDEEFERSRKRKSTNIQRDKMEDED